MAVPVGIDLGTTNSLIAAWQDGGPRIIPNALAEDLTPSAVGIDDGGNLIVGRAARDRLLTHPEMSTADFKRLMGTDVTVPVDTRYWRAEELSAMVLKALADDAAAALGARPTEAVISVPAYFSDPQRKAVLAAGRLAGLKVECLINEPTAAALAYGLEAADDATILVFDLGGGTFDVSLLDKYENVMEVRATAGDNYLGGNDARDLVAGWMVAQHKLDTGALSARERAALSQAAETAKKGLSSAHVVRYAAQLDSGPVEGELSRGAFASIVEPLLLRLRAPIARVLSDARVRPADIDHVVLVGGATRMPGVRELVGQLMGRLPLSTIDPDRVIALGAAVQAGLRARSAELKDVVMTDVCPYTLGTAVSSPHDGGERETKMSPIIERNAVIPISRQQTYVTIEDLQDRMTIPVYQGEHMTPERNVLLGKVTVPLKPAPAGEEKVDVRFTYDVNGALEVEVAVKTTGVAQSAVFMAPAALDEKEIAARFAALAALKVLPRDRAENAALIARAENLYAQLPTNRRDPVEHELLRFRRAVDDQAVTEERQGELRASFAKWLVEVEKTMQFW